MHSNPVKAFIVESHDYEESVIQFATTNVAAWLDWEAELLAKDKKLKGACRLP